MSKVTAKQIRAEIKSLKTELKGASSDVKKQVQTQLKSLYAQLKDDFKSGSSTSAAGANATGGGSLSAPGAAATGGGTVTASNATTGGASAIQTQSAIDGNGNLDLDGINSNLATAEGTMNSDLDKLSSLDPNSKDYQAQLFKLQTEIQNIQRLFDTMSNLMKSLHDTKMGIIGNMK